MGVAFPYTYVSCPCSEQSRQPLSSKRSSRDVEIDDELQEDDSPFDPRHPRSAFSLFPPEHLLYCEECRDIKCPRCVTEEIICWYCSSCLFETPSSSVRSEGNRCARNCFDCPICTSSLVTAPIGEGREGPYVLSCNYCMWTTLDIGIKFEKPTNIRQQLDAVMNGGKQRQPSQVQPKKTDLVERLLRSSSLAKEPFAPLENEDEPNIPDKPQAQATLDSTARFNALKTFYKDQIAASSEHDAGPNEMNYSSPSSLARIINLYSKTGSTSARTRQKPTVMREALTTTEGLQLAQTEAASSNPPNHADMASASQQSFQHPSYLGKPDAVLVSELRPMPSALRTKRSKRCAACKHILVKPEFKATSVRYRIKLVALSYIPLVSLKPLPVSGGLRPLGPDGGDVVLQPGKPSQWIMTLRNPLFENVSVSLGSPSITPGRHGHKVTILCPQFEIGKNGDVWDDALNNANPLNKSLMGSSSLGGPAAEQVAGKLYDQGRNWVSVVIEIVPASITLETKRALEEDEDVVEIPVRVRLEWTVTEIDGGEEKKKSGAEGNALDEDDGTRELSYWMVLGVGRVAR